jgi:transposase, IS5 family
MEVPRLRNWGQIVDATLVSAPKQRNTQEEKDAIKAGKTADEVWPDKPAKAAKRMLMHAGP